MHNQAPRTWPSAEAPAESPSIDHYRGLSSDGLSVRARADGEDFITDRKHEKSEWRLYYREGAHTQKRNECRWEGGLVEEGVKTLLLRGSTQKLSAGRKGVSGRRREDFITEREHTKIN